MAAAVTQTAPSGAVVPSAVRGLERTYETVLELRYCPVAEVESRAMSLALRIANAEGLLWETTRAKYVVSEPYDRKGTPGKACTRCGCAWPADEVETDAQHNDDCPCRPGAR